MIGMRLVCRIKVPAGQSKLVGAVAVFMDMHGIEVGGARDNYIWQTENLCRNKNAAVRCVIEFYQAAELRRRGTSGYPGSGLGAICGQELEKRRLRCYGLLHSKFLSLGEDNLV